jgi:hypothetical protein
MKCKECDQEAEWLVIDLTPFEELFLPLCENHFQKLKEMEGELNLDFYFIKNLSLESIIAEANEKWKYLNQKYLNLLKRYEKMKSGEVKS